MGSYESRAPFLGMTGRRTGGNDLFLVIGQPVYYDCKYIQIHVLTLTIVWGERGRGPQQSDLLEGNNCQRVGPP